VLLESEIEMHELTVSLTCVMMLVAPAVVALAGRMKPDEDLEYDGNR
jgi:hypothetical protein